MSVTCRIGFHRYKFQSELDRDRARVLYGKAVTSNDEGLDDYEVQEELDDYEVQEIFECYLEKAGIEFHYDV